MMKVLRADGMTIRPRFPHSRAYKLPWQGVLVLAAVNIALFLISISHRLYQRLRIETQVEAMVNDHTMWLT